ncbi:MAG: UDP-glucose 4-epimerase GalE [Bacteroidia bacterium]
MSEQIILVTGGAGYIGSHTIVALSETTGYRIISVDNYSNSSIETYARIKSITGKDIESVEADLSDKKQAEKVFAQFPGITGIIHFAAFKSVPESVSRPVEYYHNNINSLLNLLSLGTQHGVKQFIFSSSCSVYGNISDLPVNENTPVGKVESPYAYTKVIGEKILEDVLNASTGMKGIALRYFNPVGAHETGKMGELPNQRPNNLVPVITQTAIGKIKQMQVFGSDYPTRDGTCIRDYIHVCDIAEAHVKALQLLSENAAQGKFDIINLGSGEGVTVLEAIHAFEKVSGKKLNYVLTDRRAGDVEAIYSDCTKAERVLGWKAKRTLIEMMSSAWQWELNLAK